MYVGTYVRTYIPLLKKLEAPLLLSTRSVCVIKEDNDKSTHAQHTNCIRRLNE